MTSKELGRYTPYKALDSGLGKIVLHKVPLDSGGYDKGGAYWGCGEPLWETMDQDGNGFIFRSRNRESAKKYILSDFPDAKFYR